MCCSGSRFVMADYDYVIRKLVACGAVSEETAVPYEKLNIDEVGHMYAKDNFMRLLFSGSIRRTKNGYYLKKRVPSAMKSSAAV